ncbi:hypothetical protein VCHA43P277_40118 [Vibrio chagasii]|nr:hypothetical protein VCHA34P126_50119 [Vibrio chagasii]CAH7160813.1 hypothetical protein VCHA38P215_20168 [Vibrio chagasii]CAH7192775.1 hypothetical protein VCHA48P434_20239 [Vibrio chagasii]CAH7231542.1 hypothetical protein VCHA37P191_20302 [Vibrio chagasii]CAH7241271.1 hypothetical protein VCHA41O246_30176 [Vibrio chagasii]
MMKRIFYPAENAAGFINGYKWRSSPQLTEANIPKYPGGIW